VRTRLRAIQRIAGVQEQLRRSAEWKLADLQRQESALRKRESDLVSFLGGGHAFSGLFAAAMARRFRTLSEEIAAVGRAKDAQRAHLMRQAGRAKRAERLLARLEMKDRSSREAQDLNDLLEQLAGRAKASPP
jgi:hypothetical protein